MKLTNEEILTIITAHRADSLGVEDGELTTERADALDRYHGRQYGNELEGRSAVVSRDLSEAVDWAMPAIMRIFTQSGSVAEFSPVSAEDEPQAEIETEYVNQVIMKDNSGWIVLHDAIKDTLLLKNGYVKHWWEETEKTSEEEYQGLAIEELQKMLTDLQNDGAEVAITGQAENQIVTPMGIIPTYDITLQITRKQGKVKLEAVPCEEIRVSRKCRGSLQESPFVEHVTRKTRSDLIEMGMDKDWVYSLPTYTEKDTGTQSLSRDSVSDESNSYQDGSSVSDRSMDEIEYCEAYIKLDADGDGIAELRRVVTVGNRIPDGEEWNRQIPEVAITGFVAKRVPHRHVGESLFDELGDLQEIKTVLMRQLLDNVYLTNNNQWLVNERVNLADFMTSLPGGIKRIEGLEPVNGAVEAVMATPIVGQILPVVDYIDGIKENRTGISRTSTGLDTDTLKQSTKGAFLENMNRASQKVEMITRMIAETGVKEMVLRVHSLLNRYQDKARIIRMKGQYIPVNPQEWRERTDLTVKVGLGTGNEEDKRMKLMMVADLQMKLLAPQGLVGPEQAYALFADIAKTSGFDVPDKFALDPSSQQYQQKMQQPQQPPPQIQLEQMKIQASQQELVAKLQADSQKFMAENAIKQQEVDKKSALEIQRFQAEAEINRQQAEQNLQQELLRSQNDIQIKRDELQMQAELERFKAQLKAETDLKIAVMQAEMQQQQMMQQAQIDANKSAIEQRRHEEQLAAASRPKKVVRGLDGRVEGVE